VQRCFTAPAILAPDRNPARRSRWPSPRCRNTGIAEGGPTLNASANGGRRFDELVERARGGAAQTQWKPCRRRSGQGMGDPARWRRTRGSRGSSHGRGVEVRTSRTGPSSVKTAGLGCVAALPHLHLRLTRQDRLAAGADTVSSLTDADSTNARARRSARGCRRDRGRSVAAQVTCSPTLPRGGTTSVTNGSWPASRRARPALRQPTRRRRGTARAPRRHAETNEVGSARLGGRAACARSPCS
jgi:hypothetical protein